MRKYLIFLFLSVALCQESNYSSMSEKLPVGYRPMEVKLQFRIMHLYNFNLNQQTLRITGYLRQSWNDPRLISNRWDSKTPNGRKFYLMNKKEAPWIPDTFISNSIEHTERESNSGDPYGSYHYLRVYTNGDVLYSQMIDTKISSYMNLAFYPFNVLNITLNIESYGYPDNVLRYSTGIEESNEGLQIVDNYDLTGYRITDAFKRADVRSAEYTTGNFSMVEMKFYIIPSTGNLMIILLPTLMLIVISSFVFWMDVKRVMERLSLGITAMLADFALTFSLPIPITQEELFVRNYLNISYIAIGITLLISFMEYLMFKSDYADNVEIAFIQWGKQQDEFKRKKKALFVLRHRDRLIRKYIEKKFRQIADFLFSKIKNKILGQYIVLPIFILIWLIFIRFVPFVIFGLLDATLFITLEVLTLIAANVVSVFILIVEVIYLSSQSLLSYFFNMEIRYPNIYINEIRRVLYITEIWLSPPNFSRDKEQWKRERHQYDLFEYESRVRVIDRAISEFKRDYNLSKDEYRKERKERLKKIKKPELNDYQNINDLLKNSLVLFLNDKHYKRENIAGIKAGFAVLYVLMWITYVVSHLIPGFYILDKAKMGIDGHSEGVKLFPITMAVGTALSYMISVFALIRESDHNRSVVKRRLEEEKMINSDINIKDLKESLKNRFDKQNILQNWGSESIHRTEDTELTDPNKTDDDLSEISEKEVNIEYKSKLMNHFNEKKDNKEDKEEKYKELFENEKWIELDKKLYDGSIWQSTQTEELIKLKHDYNITTFGIYAKKLIGDQYIPSGEISWRVGLGVDLESPRYIKGDDIILSKRKNRKDVYFLKGKGQIADYDFKNPKWIYGELTILNEREILFKWENYGSINYRRVSRKTSIDETNLEGLKRIKSKLMLSQAGIDNIEDKPDNIEDKTDNIDEATVNIEAEVNMADNEDVKINIENEVKPIIEEKRGRLSDYDVEQV